MGLSDGPKIFRTGLVVLIQYRSVTDTQPPSQRRCCSYYAQRSGVEPKNYKITLICSVCGRPPRYAPPLYAARCGSAPRLTPGLRCPVRLASSSCGRHEYSRCKRQTSLDVRQTSDVRQHHCLMPRLGAGHNKVRLPYTPCFIKNDPVLNCT